MPASYQNGGADPLRIEELGTTPQDYVQRKQRRQILFSTISTVLVVACVFFLMVVSHHTRLSGTGSGDTTAWLEQLDESTIGGGSVATGCESTLMILRHCEKYGPEVITDGGDQHCSYIGHERAHFLPSLFGDAGWPVPSVLYALGVDRGHHLNFREVETLRPLANKYGLTIDAKFSNNDDLIEAYTTMLSSGELCGKLVVVSWKHEMIGDLAGRLGCPGCTPKEYDAYEFDEVWQLKYVFDTKGTRVYKLNTDEDGEEEVATRRMLKKQKRDKHWSVYFTRSAQGFDPLKFSALSGDYDSGTAVGGLWLNTEM